MYPRGSREAYELQQIYMPCSSVGATVYGSVGDAVGDPVGGSISAAVGGSVGGSAGGSVRGSSARAPWVTKVSNDTPKSIKTPSTHHFTKLQRRLL